MPHRFPAINDDLTHVERAEFYSAMMDASLDAVIVIDMHGIVVEWSAMAVALFGFSRKEALGTRLSTLIIPPDFADAHDAALARYRATGETRIAGRRVDMEAVDKLGRKFPIELTLSPMSFRGEHFFISRLRDISKKVRREKQLLMVAKDLEHRVKNMLAIILSLARQTARTQPDMTSFTTTFEDRVLAYKRAHDMLLLGQDRGLDLRALFMACFEPYGERTIIVMGPDIFLPPRAALTVGICIHELCTNAVKHGALSTAHGIIKVSWTIDDENLIIDWVERGGPKPVEYPTRKGFGSTLITMGLRMDLNASHTLSFPETGMVGRVTIPLVSLQPEPVR